MRDPMWTGVLSTAAYIATVPGANLLIDHVGIVPVGFGQSAPAAVYLIGAALLLRDAVHEQLGRDGALCAMAVGALLSYLLAGPQLAVASTVAFGVAEGLDWAVYEPLRRRGLTLAVLASGAVGLLADSVVFLYLAFGSFAFLPGQILGKAWMTLAAAIVVELWVRRRRAGSAL